MYTYMQYEYMNICISPRTSATAHSQYVQYIHIYICVLNIPANEGNGPQQVRQIFTGTHIYTYIYIYI